jgi:hypothetical protein
MLALNWEAHQNITAQNITANLGIQNYNKIFFLAIIIINFL